MVQASKVLGDKHTHTHMHTLTWMHTSLVPADCGWNATTVLFCPEAKEDTSLVHLCQNQFRPVSQPGRRRQTDRPRCPALLSLSLSLSLQLASLILLLCFPGFKRRKQREPLTWGHRTMQRREKKKRGSVGTKWKTKGSGRKQGGKRRKNCLVCCWCAPLDGATWA